MLIVCMISGVTIWYWMIIEVLLSWLGDIYLMLSIPVTFCVVLRPYGIFFIYFIYLLLLSFVSSILDSHVGETLCVT